MSFIKGQAPLNVSIAINSKKQLQELKAHFRQHVNPSMSMAKVLEELIDKEYRRLKLSDK